MNERPPVCLRFSILHRAMKKQIDEYMSAEDLTGVQLFVLVSLRRMEQEQQCEVNQRDLEKISHVSHPTMTDILQRLEKKGFIVCHKSEQDKRSKSIASTEKAEGLGRRLEEADTLAFERLCEGLSEQERALLISITDKMMVNALNNIKKGCENSSDKKACEECQRV